MDKTNLEWEAKPYTHACILHIVIITYTTKSHGHRNDIETDRENNTYIQEDIQEDRTDMQEDIHAYITKRHTKERGPYIPTK